MAWLAREHVHVHNMLRVITRLNPMARARIEPRSTGPRPRSIPTNRAVYYRRRLLSQKTARSTAGVEPTTFQTAATAMATNVTCINVLLLINLILHDELFRFKF